MKLHHLRNATAILGVGSHRILIDPMLSEPGALPGFKMFGGGRRKNPLVPLPSEAQAALDQVTAVLLTHEHPDHFDRPAVAWIKERGLPVWAAPVDAPNLRRKGLEIQELTDGALGMRVEIIPARHGRGVIGWFMGPVSGVYLAHPGEPSVYLTSDATLDDRVFEAIKRLQPDVILAPAGAANFGLGRDILFSTDELVALARLAPGDLVFNHLEAIDHCPTTREQLRERMKTEGLLARVHIPDDGGELEFAPRDSAPQPRLEAAVARRPGLQKWLTAFFAGT